MPVLCMTRAMLMQSKLLNRTLQRELLLLLLLQLSQRAADPATRLSCQKLQLLQQWKTTCNAGQGKVIAGSPASRRGEALVNLEDIVLAA